MPRERAEDGLSRRYAAPNHGLSPYYMNDVGKNRIAPWLNRQWWPATVAAALLLATLGGTVSVHATPLVGMAGLAVLALFLAWRTPGGQGPDVNAPALAWLGIALLICLASSLAMSPHGYILRWAPRPGQDDVLDAWVYRFLVYTALITPLFLWSRMRSGPLLLAMLLYVIYECGDALWSTTGGLALYRDDHASFLYRIWVFVKTFPQLISYDPYWNAGRTAAFPVFTGVLSIGLPFWPVWKGWPVETAYTPVVGLLFIVLVPAVAVLAVRLVRGTWPAALCAGLLALGVSRSYHMWFLHFGTVPACWSAALYLMVCASLYRAIWLNGTEWWNFALLVISGFLVLAWPLSYVMVLPIGLAVLTGIRSWNRRSALFLIAGAVVLLLICAPSLAAILTVADVDSVARGQQGIPSLSEVVRACWKYLGGQFRNAHPLLIFFGLGGFLLAPRPPVRRFFAVVGGGLLLLGMLGPVLKPNMQLERSFFPLLFVSILPASLWFGRVFARQGWGWAMAKAALVVLATLGGLNSAKLYANHGPARYEVISRDVLDLVDWLSEHTRREGRILFAGPTVHAFGYGHVAYLAARTDRQMMACDYFHFPPSVVEYEYPPRAFRQEPEDVFRFLDLYNVSHVITYHGRWKKFFRNFPDRFEEVHEFGKHTRKVIFQVRRELDMFHRGRGRVRADLNRFEVEVPGGQEEVVLKYHWTTHLQADAPVELFPADVGDGVTFIGIRPRGVERFVIRHRRWP